MKKLMCLLALCFLPVVAVAQMRAVTGRILDSERVPVTGVSVVAGTLNGSQFTPNGNTTTTNSDGRFSIKVPPSDGALKFSFIGMLDQIAPIPDGGNYDLGDMVMQDGLEKRRGAIPGSGDSSKK